MPDIKGAVQGQFDAAAAHYRTSAVHAAGIDLPTIARLVQQHGGQRVLDAGCGAGHTSAAAAPYVREVVALDLTPSMLAQVNELAQERGLTNITTRQGDVEQLPFDDAEFDIVVTRYSAHHWPHPQVAVHECARVLKPGGWFILSDIMAADDPAQDTFLQVLEVLRDPSHVRDYSIAQWQAYLGAAGLYSEVIETWSLFLDFVSWVARINTPPQHIEMLKTLYDGASSEIREAFRIQPNYDFNIPGALLKSVK
jgi:ubiquinone/menaquinone biosynthesis C-methylase UbiE